MRRAGLAAMGLIVLMLGAPLAALPTAEGLLPPPIPAVTLQRVAGGFTAPVFATHAGDLSMRLFVVEQIGLVKVIDDGAVQPTPWLDVRSKVRCCGEQGLLGLAFHPLFELNGKVFISYTRASDGASVLEKLTVADPANGRPPASGEVLLVVPQPFSNHNGGWIGFGPDGYLYMALGDGGAGGDPFNLAQNKNSLLGKMLRLDVDGETGYRIPPTNPYALLGGGRPEIWALGLRNPWRVSFDRVAGDLWIADVGQGAWEEVNLQPRASPGGENYGWRWFEGNHAYVGGGPTAGMTFPVFEYSHALGCSVTGGYVYRGTGAPGLTGAYLYADFCSGRIWAGYAAPRPAMPIPGTAPAVGTTREILDTPHLISSFGEDELGEVYVVTYGGWGWGGELYRIRQI